MKFLFDLFTDGFFLTAVFGILVGLIWGYLSLIRRGTGQSYRQIIRIIFSNLRRKLEGR